MIERYIFSHFCSPRHQPDENNWPNANRNKYSLEKYGVILHLQKSVFQVMSCQARDSVFTGLALWGVRGLCYSSETKCSIRSLVKWADTALYLCTGVWFTITTSEVRCCERAALPCEAGKAASSHFTIIKCCLLALHSGVARCQIQSLTHVESCAHTHCADSPVGTRLLCSR